MIQINFTYKKAAGAASVVSGFLIFMFRDVLANTVFQAIPKDKASTLLVVIITVAIVVGLIALFGSSHKQKSVFKQTKIEASSGGVAFGKNAKKNKIETNKSRAKKDR